MDSWSSILGLVLVRITSSEPQKLLKVLTDNDIEIFDLHDGNDLTVTLKIGRNKLKLMRKLLKQNNAELKVIGRVGVFWSMRRILFRPMMVMSLLLVLITAIYLPRRVCFVQVQGNEIVPDNLILSCAQECGIGFGALRSEVRSERVKNMLLSKIPQIQWVGVNTQGCTAIITVREKSQDGNVKGDNRIRSIVAVCDGVVGQCTVTKGNALCRPGMAVREGQTLVSAYTDCGITIQATRAEAEIFGTTKRNIQLVTPSQTLRRCGNRKKVKKYSIIIGKKQIKFYKGSGISDGECVKMKMVKYLTLPGGYQLPIALVTECIETCDSREYVPSDLDWVVDYAETHLRSVMISGRICSSEIYDTCSTDVYSLTGVYDCYEIIGIPKYEEINE